MMIESLSRATSTLDKSSVEDEYRSVTTRAKELLRGLLVSFGLRVILLPPRSLSCSTAIQLSEVFHQQITRFPLATSERYGP